ncbi:RNA polymerase sigma factor [Streptomyces sp. LN325]|uniref:RNA polymerase sigma factor n=1 Tax=Streptomyces sp. LN325 TaxID=3112976 RepID=UPI00371AE18D
MFEISDERLAAELKKSSGNTPAHHPVGELLDRHWEAVFGYARLCTNGVRPAGMLTTAAFTRLFGESLRQTGPTAAWRPQLLVTVRRMTAEWLADQRRGSLHPELLAGPDGEAGVVARLLPPEGRRLLSRAFQRLPEPARCLLWHAEVEAEQLALPAALLGIREDAALVELRQARERLREGCLEIHRELAPEEECRQYHRMLDVSLRRGGDDLDPDLRRHMGRCRHCRNTAEQLNHFNGELALPLAESVLGWGAEAYLASRPGRAVAIVEVTDDAPGGPGIHATPPPPGQRPPPAQPAPTSRAARPVARRLPPGDTQSTPARAGPPQHRAGRTDRERPDPGPAGRVGGPGFGRHSRGRRPFGQAEFGPRQGTRCEAVLDRRRFERHRAGPVAQPQDRTVRRHRRREAREGGRDGTHLVLLGRGTGMVVRGGRGAA